ncbi:GDP-perosamine synthase [Pandoraea morbifera]|uniref:GDP-perosamine synthase n=1 Tax=Pandoraea morbifera TaxID=2508300 RepID=A0A5E4X6K0_9BURK|nr:DegT/DnrJ/EryC1/StrS family aminotransferase [Pandoraea morbifera]VVE31967.1 GDP-perosamine synthase [Pandoraea morbifera]
MAILKNPEQRDAFSRRLKFAGAAREAWRYVIERTPHSKHKKVLLPAYIGITDREGSGIFDPVELAQANPAFYRVDDLLRPDYDDIARQLANGDVGLILVVHYFGVVEVDLARVRALCDANAVVMIEDCAHVSGVLTAPGPIGQVGDAAFYSLHKAIAAPSGGMLKINNPSAFLDIDFANAGCDPTVVEQLYATDFETVNRIRRENYAYIAGRLSGVEGVTVLYPEIGDKIPHDFPICIHDGLREKLYFRLADHGMPTVALYYRMIPEIDRSVYPVSHGISQSILNLPVHQETTLADLERLLDTLTLELKVLRKETLNAGAERAD